MSLRSEFRELRFLHKNDVRFVFITSFFLEVVSNTYCVEFLFCFSFILGFSGLSIYDCPFAVL